MVDCNLPAQSSPLVHGSRHARKCSTNASLLLTACVLDGTCQIDLHGELLTAAQVLASRKIFTTPPSLQGHRGQSSPLTRMLVFYYDSRGTYDRPQSQPQSQSQPRVLE
jgi:hypothetical protein